MSIFYRHTLLSEIARKGGFRKVLVGVNATKLAVRLLSNVAQGRGATLPLDVVHRSFDGSIVTFRIAVVRIPLIIIGNREKKWLAIISVINLRTGFF